MILLQPLLQDQNFYQPKMVKHCIYYYLYIACSSFSVRFLDRLFFAILRSDIPYTSNHQLVALLLDQLREKEKRRRVKRKEIRDDDEGRPGRSTLSRQCLQNDLQEKGYINNTTKKIIIIYEIIIYIYPLSSCQV